MMIRIPVLLLIALLSGCASLPPAGTLEGGASSVELPARFWGKHVFVTAQITDSDSAWLLLDTGADMTVLSLSAAREFGVPVTGIADAEGYGRDTLRGGVTPVAIRLAGSKPYHLYRPVLDLSAMEPFLGKRFEGILGGDLFLRFVVEIDYARERVILHDPRRFRPDPDDVRLTLEIDGQRPHIRGVVVLPDGREINGRFVVDTGAGTSVTLYAPFVAAHGILDVMPTTVGRRTAGIGGQGEDREGRLRAIRMGPVVLNEPIFTLSLAEAGLAASDRTAGSIGAGVLARFAVTVDYRRGALYLRPNSQIDEPFEADMTGFAVVAAGADFREYVVEWIDDDSPAGRAGLKEGDLIVKISGRPAADFSMPEWHDLKRGEPGQVLELVVQRGADMLSIPIRLERRI